MLRRALCGLRRLIMPDVCGVCLRTACSPGERICRSCLELLNDLPAPRCRLCGGAVDGVLDCCGECLRQPPRPWDHAVSVFPFRDLPRELVHRFKYQQHTWLAPVLASRMAENWRQYGEGVVDCICPVPLHWGKHLRRGYNQSALLAEELGRELGVPTRSLLRRIRFTRTQTQLSLEQRRENARGVFAPVRRVKAAGLHILVVDDVLTTGATLAAAATALRESDARRLSVITVARG